MTATIVIVFVALAVISLGDNIADTIRDIALAKHQTKHCNGCTCDSDKEKSA
ncbi:hypothetical protein ACWD25_35505 [Streptomyces sp. NPDC002920]